MIIHKAEREELRRLYEQEIAGFDALGLQCKEKTTLGHCLRLLDALDEAESKLDWRAKDEGSTHSEECWKWHYHCAMAKIGELERGLAEAEQKNEQLLGRPVVTAWRIGEKVI